MERRRIGSLDVSVVGLGCNNFGKRLDFESSERVIGAAVDAGINFFDTADVYGETRSEEFLGRVLEGRRSAVYIATKFGRRIDERRKGAKPAYVRSALEASLRRLRTDYVDLYQLHQPDPDVPIADTQGALDDLVRAGKVREIGSSQFSVDRIREAEAARKPGAARFVSVQNEYSLLEREPERGVLSECRERGIAFLPYFPLACGLLTGKYRVGKPEPEGARLSAGSPWAARFLTAKNFAQIEQLTAFAEARGHTLLELAVSWLLTRPVVASVIAGATSADQVNANVRAARWHLGTTDLASLDRIAPPRES
ncbi:MAG: aldo/keto reductase [Polyangiaceae bacterium]|jgi:aryl-alcohol dehydrogenase-like predicted oxidoreductase